MWLNVCIEEKLLDLGLVWKNTNQGILPAQNLCQGKVQALTISKSKTAQSHK